MNQKGDIVIILASVIGVAIIAVVVFSVIVSITGFHYETGKGSHTGYVTATETEGVFFKTGRAYVKTDLASTQEDIYCVVDDGLLADLEQAAQEKKQVTVKHLSWFAAGIKNCKSEPAVIVELIEE